jgi:hypothetical protein
VRVNAPKALDRIGLWLLIYEGGLLAARMATGRKLAPTISEVVWWAKPRRYGWLPPLVVAGWLLWHLERPE